MTTPEKEICENCCGEFEPRFSNQKMCYSCWLETRQGCAEKSKQRLFGALGQKYYNRNRGMAPWLDNPDFAPAEEPAGLWDKELIHDEDYIENVTQSIASKGGQVPELRNPEKKLGSKSAIGQQRSDGLIGKQPLREKAVLIGRFPLREGRINQKTMPSRVKEAKILCETKPSLIRIVSPTGDVRFTDHEKVKAILTDSPLWFE
jgi:hypothetical protein